jgi:hypothetical protein
MSDFSGRWIGSIRGTNTATFALLLEQTDQSLRGELALNDAALGLATFQVEGTAGDAVASFRLIPGVAAPGAENTEGVARAALQPDGSLAAAHREVVRRTDSMTWFRRDHTGRVLRPLERDFVVTLGAHLAELAAPQVDEDETALTAEGHACLIVLIPHRALGGVSIVVWLFEDRAEVTWAQVAGLDCCHDALDLGISVGQFRLDPARPDFGPVLECVRQQINEPLTLRCFGSDRATVLVRDYAGKLCKVGEVGSRVGWSVMLRRARPTHETVIRLADPEPPPVTAPSGVDEWFD